MAVTRRLLVMGAFLALQILLATGAANAQENARGERLFQLCTQCHGANAGGNPLALAPSIAGLEKWYVERQLYKYRDGVRGAHFDDIGGMRMRAMARILADDADLQAVAAYVASLPPVKPAPTLSGDATRGQQFYTPCIACHGPQAKGNEALGAPALNHQSDWYLLTQLKNFRSGVRGTNPKDQQGALMRPMSMTLPDEQALLDVIAYIESLAN